LLDVNAMAAGKGFFGVDDGSQPGQPAAGLAEDDVGRRQYVIRFKDLDTGEILPDDHRRSPNLVWADDDRTCSTSRTTRKPC
jgi:oligopeptidase B